MKNYVSTYTTLSESTSKLVRRQMIVQAESREEAIQKSITELSDENQPFKLNSCKEWDVDNISNPQKHIETAIADSKKKK